MTQPLQPGQRFDTIRPWRAGRGKAVLWGIVLWGLTVPVLMHASELFPIPDVIRPNVYFWKKVFAEVDVTGGVLHDINDLAIIYEGMQDLPGNAQSRQSTISGYREYYQAILLTLASGRRTGLSQDEARVLAMFKGNDSAEALATAAANLRFQGGMREKFIRGLIRSGAHVPEIERIFAAAGLPTELAYLPHIESSFENRAVSKVGAAGIWQIMPATGRRYLTVNGRVDERLHIPTATAAAAQILQENYEQLGTWPLAITAYNHGLYGMKQAVETMGTTDFGIIFQYYRGPAFGFASQNFYPEFVAAVDVARNYKRYFGDIYFDPPVTFGTMARQQRGSDNPYEQTPPRTFSATPAQPRDTPAPEPKQYAQQPVIPALQKVRDTNQDEKAAAPTRPSSVARQVQPPSSRDQQPAAPEPGQTYRVQAGDTFTTIARQFRTTTAQLAALNNLSRRYMVKAGETLVITASAPPAAEKAAPQTVAKVMASDATSQSGTAQKATAKVSPKAVTDKTLLVTPSQPTPVKPMLLAVATPAATASTQQRTVVKTAATGPSNHAKTSVVKTSPEKSPSSKVPAAVTVVSVPKATVSKTTPPEAAKPVVANTTKAAAGKVVTKEASVEAPKSASVNPTKAGATKSPGPREEPKATPVSTRAPTRRSNPKGA